MALPRWLLYTLSFAGGFLIMVLEICGFRVLATNLGSSVIVTGTLLTVVMIVLSFGYYFGGLLSQRRGGARNLFGLLVLSTAYTGVMTVVAMEPLAELSLELHDALKNHVFLRSGLPATLLSVVLYGPPVFVMSMISPYLIRMHTLGASQGDPGVQSGFFMSLSTLGSIAGTMLASYVLVPFFGVERSALWTSALFFLIACACWLKAGTLSARAQGLAVSGVVLTLLFLLTLGARTPELDPSVVYRQESHYGELSVMRDVDDAGRTVLTYHPSRIYMHSLLYPDEPLRDLEGTMYLVPGLVRPPQSVLVLGSAAGGSLRALELAFPKARITGVDLDPKVHEVATKMFGVDAKRHHLVTADARMHLASSTERYDLIIVDLFSGEFIPSHCVSVEFFELVKQRLSANGSLFINTNMNDIQYELDPEGEPFRAVRHLQATLRAAGFPSLFENSFFHSLFAFPDVLPATKLRADLLAQFADAKRSEPLRAAAGIAAFSTVEVPDRTRYRVFTDRWTPSFLIELKSNAKSIYDELEQAPPSGNPDTLISERVLARHHAERGSGEGSLTDPAALITSLNDVVTPLDKTALDTAVRHFRFSRDAESSDAEPTSDWARLAALFARFQQQAYANDYESVLGTLGELRDLVAAPAD
ncbi:fused MFS/spermidine synthase [Xanthomonas sp. GW]|uniref:fused MFS/spermidine synthase n=1 Tax=Xanthomonas sp. GW TaxID=2724121 RepID=UPI0016395895|nr:fused MFS/spermidine synthase [Xanthomonas sp. GW]